jgi:pimeloyl-ACP methyl ester carboxylesterase
MRLLWRLPHRLLPRHPLRQAMAQVLRRVPAATIAARLREVFRVHAREDLRRCACRILYLAGRSDHVVSRRNVDLIARLRPGLERVGVEGRHFALFTNPVKAASFVATFAWLAAGRE